ncbi:MAG: SHOCT domain-containing protein [Chloroflexi bacterium]|nr:SHOCT domain-containing protein [Chloroflexota bacterium]
MMGFYGGFGWFNMLFMSLFWIGLLALVVWGLVGLFSRTGGTSCGSSAGSSALEILKARYARGEITKEEFEAMKRDLS